MTRPDNRPWPKTCDRCGSDLGTTSSTMSKFNVDIICAACDEDERLAPGFTAARAIEDAAVRGGNYNHPGVGLSNDDRAFLADRRRQRRTP